MAMTRMSPMVGAALMAATLMASAGETPYATAATVVTAATAAAGGAAAAEAPAPPERFEVVSAGGARLRGAAARIDVRHAGTGAGALPVVEVTFSASDGTRTWSAHVLAPPEFLQSLKLRARVTDRPLAPGQASVQTGAAGADATLLRDGILQLELRLSQGRLEGTYGRAAVGGRAARTGFSGPFVVSCSVPASALPPHATAAPAAAGDGTGTATPTRVLVVDTHFGSAPCKPLAGWSTRR